VAKTPPPQPPVVVNLHPERSPWAPLIPSLRFALAGAGVLRFVLAPYFIVWTVVVLWSWGKIRRALDVP
jgi:hypothetical protein